MNFKEYYINERQCNETIDIDLFNKWKRRNVTYRGMKSIGEYNKVYGSWGNGLYSVPLSNKAMAKQYGNVYFVVGGIPNNPMIVQSVNSAEIVRQNLIIDFNKNNNVKNDFDIAFFEEHTSMDKELIKKGYDGFIIKGREIVNYKPTNVKYFETKEQLLEYYKKHEL
jgi:hypothetical protein